jgi:REP element-mobilizing transposase RayT
MEMDKGNDLPKRKRLRREGFDYSTPGGYFITICTKDRKPLFGPVGADSISARMIERTFIETIERYENVESPIYVVMPNHFHAIIEISRADMESAPTGLPMFQTHRQTPI